MDTYLLAAIIAIAMTALGVYFARKGAPRE
jgi:hypothetical protein